MLKKKPVVNPMVLEGMDDKNDCNSKTKENRTNHNSSHDIGEDTSQSGGDPGCESSNKTQKKGKRVLPCSSSEPRSSKRLRLQYQPFQSPSLHIPQIKPSKPSEEKQIVYMKGEFLALRNESESFFICQAAQNVYKSSHKFRIRWLSKSESGSDVYSRDFYDCTDFECVLTNIQMERLDKNLFRLPKEEALRTEQILKKAISLENGVNDLESDHNETPMVSIEKVKTEEETVREPTKLCISVRRASIDSSKALSGRQSRYTAERHQPIARAEKAKLKKVILASRLKGKTNKANKVKVKQKNSRDIEVRSRSRRAEEKPTLKQKIKSAIEKERRPFIKLSTYSKDPTFESNNVIPFVSTVANSKLLIRAVLMNDFKALQNIFEESGRQCWIGVCRSVDQRLDALAYALLQENHNAIELIMNERQHSIKTNVKLPERLLLHHSVGRSNFKSLGSCIKEISLSRGGREGNSALMKDNYEELTDQDYVTLALERGVSKETLDVFCSLPGSGKQPLKHLVISNLFRAVWYGHRQLASQLIEDAMKTDGYGFNTLHKEVLIFDRHDLSPFRPDAIKKRSFGNCGITPLHCAAINPVVKYLKQLIEMDPEFNTGDAHMRKPIHYAAACEGPCPLEFLLSKGIKTDETDIDGNTALHVAAETGRVHNVELLLRKAKVDKRAGEDNKIFRDYGFGGINRPNRATFTSLHLACIMGHLDVVKALLKYGADIKKPSGINKNKVTPLMLACQGGHLEVVKYLLQSGAKLESRDKLRRTAVTHSIVNGHAHVLSYLLKSGADPNDTDSSGNSLLHYGVAYGWWFCIKLLLDVGVSINVVNDWKVTPLGIAFLKGHIGLSELLLNQPEIDVDFRDDNGMSIVMLAVCSPLVPELVKLIRLLIVDKLAKCSVTDIHGNTALHWLACNSIYIKGHQVCEDSVQASLQIAKLLLENDCDPSVRNYHGQTVLTLAIQQGNNELVKLLLSDGCQVTAEVDDTGENLLHALVDHSWETNLASLVQIIKENPGKKTKVPLLEESLEVNLKDPTVPLLENLSGILRIGDVICIRGVLDKSFEEFHINLLQGCHPDKDDSTLTCSVKMLSSSPQLSCTNRINGEVKKSEKEIAFPVTNSTEGADAKRYFDLSIICQEDHFQIMAGGTSIISFPTDISPKQVTHLYVTEGVILSSIQVERSSVTKTILPSVSLPSDVLREMAQTYSYDGFTPLLLACSKYHFTTERKQQERLRHMIKTLIEEAESEIHSLVKKRSDNKSRKIDGFSALHFLASTKEVPVVVDGVRNEVPGLSLLLNYKPPINIQDHRGRTPLITAILNRHPAAAEALINAGAAINMCSGDMDDDGRASPLILAAKLGLVSVIKLLLKHGANVQLADEKNHSTALHYAVTMKSLTDALEVVRCLIEAGININSVNQDGRTPLHLAVNANSGSTDDMIEIEDLLIEKGADQLARDSLGRLPLHYAFVKIGRPSDSSKIDPIEVVTLLTGTMKGNIDVPDHYGQTPLHCAAFRGATISCMHLAQSVTNLNAKDKNGNTALSLAVLGSHESCAIMLLQKGASVQVDVVMPLTESLTRERAKKRCWQWKPATQTPVQPKRTPLLQEVVQKDWQGVMYMMLGQLEASGANYFPAIEAALKTGKFKLALNLISRSKHWDKCNMCNKSDQNLLHILASMAKCLDQPELQVKVAQVLINRGVPLTSRDNNGSSPLLYAAMNRNFVLCDFFTEQLGMSAVVKIPPNKFGCSPVSSLFWNLGLFQWQSPKLKDIRAWCQKLCSHGVSCNDLVAYPYLDNCPGESWAYIAKNAEHQSGEITCRISPLIYAVCLQDYDLVAFLLQQGADINFPDEHGRTPLMHAVHKNDIGMVRLLLNPSYSYKTDMCNLMQKRHLNKVMTFKNSDVKSSTQSEQLTWESTKEDLSLQHAKHNSVKETNAHQTTQLNERTTNGPIVRNKNNHDAFLGSGLNCETFPDKENDEVEVIEDIDEEEKQVDVEVKPLPVSKATPISLTQTDRHGWTVIHHLIRPVSCGTYDNAEILYLLAEAGAPLNISNTAGFSPLQMAVQSRACRLALALRKLLGIPTQESPLGSVVDSAVKDGIHWDREPWDYKADSAAILERVESEAMEEGEEDNIVLPDVHSGMEEMGEVVVDSEQNIPYDVFMTKVDLSCGISGCYSFFKMQVISQQGKNLHILFTRWGKLGTEGEYQQSPFCSADDATREFCRIFKAKSGNNWQDVKNFRPVTRKYRLVEALRRGRRKLRDISLTLATDVPSKLPQSLQDLMTDLTNVTMLQEACQDIGIDTSIMPFGRLCEAALQRGRQILRELKNVVTEKIKLNLDMKNKDKVIELAEKVIDLSSEYSQVVPQPGYVYEKVRPLENLDDIQDGLDNLEYMFDLELVSKILLGAQLRMKEVNPFDYVYRAMDCQISAMQEEDMESQYILQYFHNTSLSQTPSVERIYKVSRREEVVRSQTSNGNRWLLWHGISVANLISVLTRGLNTLRFTDSFEMSQRMCKYSAKRTTSTQYVLLCEVSLQQNDDSCQSPGEGENEKQTTKLLGTYFPDPVCNLILSTGVTIPLGSLTCKYNNEGMTVLAQSDYNEYIVSSREQVSIRYIVCYHYEPSERHHKANKVPTHS